MPEKRSRYALCIDAGEDEDLQARRVYEILPDALAAKRGHLRVVDDSGEDYLYPADSFVLLDLPRAAEEAFLARRPRARAKHADPSFQRTGSARR